MVDPHISFLYFPSVLDLLVVRPCIVLLFKTHRNQGRRFACGRYRQNIFWEDRTVPNNIFWEDITVPIDICTNFSCNVCFIFFRTCTETGEQNLLLTGTEKCTSGVSIGCSSYEVTGLRPLFSKKPHVSIVVTSQGYTNLQVSLVPVQKHKQHRCFECLLSSGCSFSDLMRLTFDWTIRHTVVRFMLYQTCCLLVSVLQGSSISFLK